jgi:hypothetical protein
LVHVWGRLSRLKDLHLVPGKQYRYVVDDPGPVLAVTADLTDSRFICDALSTAPDQEDLRPCPTSPCNRKADDAADLGVRWPEAGTKQLAIRRVANKVIGDRRQLGRHPAGPLAEKMHDAERLGCRFGAKSHAGNGGDCHQDRRRRVARHDRISTQKDYEEPLGQHTHRSC